MDRLEVRIERLLRTGEGDFEVLALELFNYQFEKNQPYQVFCKAQRRTPDSVTHWQEIPAVPIRAFKSTPLATFPIGQSAAVFHSSGTSQQVPSRHFLRSLNFYELSLTASFNRYARLSPRSMPFLIFAPAPAEAPHSSLSWMLDVVKRRWGTPGSDTFIRNGQIEDWKLFRYLSQTQSSDQPLTFLGTTLAFLKLFDLCAQKGLHFEQVAGSCLMDTGGMKTQQREVSRSEFLRLVWTYLGIPEAGCVNEYGMCELSSQFYARGASPVFQGPPWVRTLIIDPVTSMPAGVGKTGLLRHFDIANVDSVLAIQTEDLGEPHADGFIFKGRAQEADLKGCSLAMEAYLGKS